MPSESSTRAELYDHQSLNFDANTFEPFLPQVVASLVQLTAEADSLEAKRRINDSLNTVIERAESRVCIATSCPSNSG